MNLFTTTHCHLCEQALNLLAEFNDWSVNTIEIAYNNHLVELYGHRIPVIQRIDTLAELIWPFSKLEINDFLRD